MKGIYRLIVAYKYSRSRSIEKFSKGWPEQYNIWTVRRRLRNYVAVRVNVAYQFAFAMTTRPIPLTLPAAQRERAAIISSPAKMVFTAAAPTNRQSGQMSSTVISVVTSTARARR